MDLSENNSAYLSMRYDHFSVLGVKRLKDNLSIYSNMVALANYITDYNKFVILQGTVSIFKKIGPTFLCVRDTSTGEMSIHFSYSGRRFYFEITETNIVVHHATPIPHYFMLSESIKVLHTFNVVDLLAYEALYDHEFNRWKSLIQVLDNAISKAD